MRRAIGKLKTRHSMATCAGWAARAFGRRRVKPASGMGSQAGARPRWTPALLRWARKGARAVAEKREKSIAAGHWVSRLHLHLHIAASVPVAQGRGHAGTSQAGTSIVSPAASRERGRRPMVSGARWTSGRGSPPVFGRAMAREWIGARRGGPTASTVVPREVRTTFARSLRGSDRAPGSSSLESRRPRELPPRFPGPRSAMSRPLVTRHHSTAPGHLRNGVAPLRTASGSLAMPRTARGDRVRFRQGRRHSSAALPRPGLWSRREAVSRAPVSIAVVSAPLSRTWRATVATKSEAAPVSAQVREWLSRRSIDLVWRNASPAASGEMARHSMNYAATAGRARPAPAPAVTSSTREVVCANALDPALANRVAEDVIRRIDLRARIERERRGL